ncbi:1178_t:CDS:2, partial [Racocetra persica]
EAEKVKNSIKNFNFIFLVKVEEMRNVFMQQFRADWESKGKIFFHKNTILTMALGSDKSNEIEDNLSELTKEIYGECGLFLTSKPLEEVREYIENFTWKEYARPRSIATETVTIPAGIVSYQPEKGGHPVQKAVNDIFKKMEAPTVAENDTVCLLDDYTICKVGDPLSVHQAHILKLLGYKTVTCRLLITHYYDKIKQATFRF